MTQPDEILDRKNKLQALVDQGIWPYPARVKRTDHIGAMLASFDELMKEGNEHTIVGRVRLLRRHGGLSFVRLEDESGTIQILLSKKAIPDAYKLLDLTDLGDFLQVSGKLILSKTGEKTVEASGFEIICKSIRPLPDKWHGLQNEEERYRRRYVDLIMNGEVREFFRKRSLFVAAMREFLNKEGFMEVETPVLEHIPGGAEAEPFVTHHNTLDIDLYLRISLELHLKRLMVGGFEKIFEIGKVFRNEGMSTQHLQEFTMMECYWAYADNEPLMDMVQRLYQAIIQKTFGTLQIECRGHKLDFSGTWPRVDYIEQVKKETGIDLDKMEDAKQLRAEIKKKKIDLKFDPKAGLGRLIDQLYKKTVRPKLVGPCFLVNHPVAVSPLAKRHQNNPKRVERHQVLILGAEVGNGFSELNDPIDQRNRFEEQVKMRESGDKEAYMLDEDFLQAIEIGMPPTAGFGVGIDRLLSIVANQESIRDTVLFPTMKPKE